MRPLVKEPRRRNHTNCWTRSYGEVVGGPYGSANGCESQLFFMKSLLVLHQMYSRISKTCWPPYNFCYTTNQARYVGRWGGCTYILAVLQLRSGHRALPATCTYGIFGTLLVHSKHLSMMDKCVVAHIVFHTLCFTFYFISYCYCCQRWQ